jgi:hypothetical protein
MATTAHSGVPAKAPSRKDLSGPALRTFSALPTPGALRKPSR